MDHFVPASVPVSVQYSHLLVVTLYYYATAVDIKVPRTLWLYEFNKTGSYGHAMPDQ